MQHDQLTRPALRDIVFDMIVHSADGQTFICGYNGNGQTIPLDPFAISDLPPILMELMADVDSLQPFDPLADDLDGFEHEGRRYAVSLERYGRVQTINIVNMNDNAPSRTNFDEIERNAERVVQEKVRELRAVIENERKAARRRGKLN